MNTKNTSIIRGLPAAVGSGLALVISASNCGRLCRPAGSFTRLAFAAAFLLALVTFVGAADAIKTTGSGQNTTKDEDVVELQRFVVTGSNIKRMDIERVLPVTVINTEAMETRNAFTPVDLLTSLPQVINVPLNETQTGSSGARGDNASINKISDCMVPA